VTDRPEESFPPTAEPSVSIEPLTDRPEYESAIREIIQIAESFGLSLFDIFFRNATKDNLSFMASFGLPNRFSHWYFGGLYKSLKIQQDKNLMSILELVLNTDPVYAFLLDTNSHLENLMVIAHVMGHVDFFKNNTWYVRSDRNILNHCEQHARRIKAFKEECGSAVIDEYIEAALTVSNTVTPFEKDESKKQKRIIYFFTEATRARAKALKKSDPRKRQFRVRHEILDMMSREMEYFDLIGKTQIINEGWASFVEFKILEKLLDPAAWMEYSLHFSKRPPPYLIGFSLFNDNFRKGGWDKVLEIRRYYEDISYIDHFMTQELVQDLDLFVVDRESKEKDYSVGKVKAKIVEEKLTRGAPQVIVKDLDRNTLALVLTNQDPKRTLEKDRTDLFLKKLHTIWPYEITILDGDITHKVRPQSS